ncbi:MAG: DegT/DnrJ/EryC1/StrS aminotransferase family protein [Deltaproteobacteria bacterium]|nr:DegT/DnrJ/EryC1/StrS aminotransferase family protein [Deltaproteobacteria bacterium]
MKIPLIKPYITQEVKDKVCDVLDSGYLTEGPVTEEFEKAFREYVGCGYADVISIVGARIVIVDVSRDTMLIDYDMIEKAVTGRTRAIIPVSIFGNPLDYDRFVFPETTLEGRYSCQSSCFYIKNRNQVMQKMRDRGIEVQIGTYALHMHPAFAPSSCCGITGEGDW